MAVTLAEFAAVLGLEMDGASFARGEQALGSLRKGILGMGALVAGAALALGDMVKRTADTADETGRMAQSLGVTTQTLQELQYAAKVTGVGAEGMQTGMRLLARTMYDVQHGSKQAAQAFNEMGVATTGADGKLRPMEDVLGDVADHVASLPDGTEKTALAMKAFGRSGAAMIPLLNRGSAGIADLSKEAEALGVVLDDDTIKQGEELHESMERASAALTGVRNAIAGPLMSALTPMLQGFTKWVAANRQIIATKIHQVIEVIGKGLKIAWIFLKPVVGLFVALAKNTKVLTGLLIVLGVALLAMAGEYAVAGAAAIASAVAAAAAWLLAAAPVALLVGLLALLVLAWQDIYVGLTGGRSLIFDLFNKWGELLESWTFGSDKDGWLLRDIKAAIGYLTHLSSLWEAFKIEIGVEKVKTLEEAAGVHDAWVTATGRELTKDEIGNIANIEGRGANATGSLNGEEVHFQKNIGVLTREQIDEVNRNNAAAAQDRLLQSSPTLRAALPFQRSDYGNPNLQSTQNVTVNVNGAGDPQAVAGAVADKIADVHATALRQAKDNL